VLTGVVGNVCAETVGAVVTAGKGGKDCADDDGARVGTFGDVISGIVKTVSAKASHVGPMIGIVLFILTLAIYSDSVHLFTNSDAIPW
jgi:hypothetical protein